MTRICQNCGAETSKPVCEYCGTAATPSFTRKKACEKEDNPYYILPWPEIYGSDDDIIAICFANLRNQRDVPVDIFDYITDVRVMRYYLPFRQYMGTIKAPVGDGDYDFFIPTASVDSLQKSLVHCLDTITLDEGVSDKSEPLSPELIDDRAVIVDEDPKKNDKDIQSLADSRIKELTVKVLSKISIVEDKEGNIASAWYNHKIQNRHILVPAATVTYVCGGNEYTYVYIFNAKTRKEYPIGDNEVISEVVTRWNRVKNPVYVLAFVSLALTIMLTILCFDIKYIWVRLFSLSLTWYIFSIVVRKIFFGFSVHNAELCGASLSAIRRTVGLKKAFPQYADHPAIDKVETDETGCQIRIDNLISEARGLMRDVILITILQAAITVLGLMIVI